MTWAKPRSRFRSHDDASVKDGPKCQERANASMVSSWMSPQPASRVEYQIPDSVRTPVLTATWLLAVVTQRVRPSSRLTFTRPTGTPWWRSARLRMPSCRPCEAPAMLMTPACTPRVAGAELSAPSCNPFRPPFAWLNRPEIWAPLTKPPAMLATPANWMPLAPTSARL